VPSHLEIEKKYQLLSADIHELAEKLSYAGEKQVVDNYFDTLDGQFYQDGIFIRIRNQSSLDVKFNPDHLGKSNISEYASCHEYSFREPFQESDDLLFKNLGSLTRLCSPAGASFQSFLDANNLYPLLVIDKMRQTYTNELYTVVVDRVKNLGIFMEVEYSGPQDHGLPLKQILAGIDALVKELPAKPLSTGCFEMILRQKNFELYKKGKYLLEKNEPPNITSI
jgi:adenylate cyclase class IV